MGIIYRQQGAYPSIVKNLDEPIMYPMGVLTDNTPIESLIENLIF